MTASPNLDRTELAKFDQADLRWWDAQGPMRTLHDINPVRLQYIQDRCPVRGKQVADIGCGGGLLAERLAKAGASVVGIDAAAHAIEIARRHAQDADLALDYHCEDVHTYSQQHPASYDVVVCMELLEHVPDPWALVADCVHLLRPGGSLIASTLNRTPQAFALAIVGAEYLLNLLPRGTHRYDQFIRPSELARAMRDLGLVVADTRGFGYNPLTHTAQLTDSPAINYLMHGRLD